MRSSYFTAGTVGLLAGALLLSGCSSDAASPGAPSGPRFSAVDATLPGWFEATPALSAEILATAYAASAPTTLRTWGDVESIDRRGTTPDEVVEDYTTGDYSEVLTDAAKAQMATIVGATSAASYASVEVTPCEDAGVEAEQPHEIWSDAVAGELLARSCVYVVGTPVDPDAPQTESLEEVVLAVEVPDDDTTVGTGPTSRVVLLDPELLHAIGDSGLPWYEYVADRL